MSQNWNEIALNLTIRFAFDVVNSAESNSDKQYVHQEIDKERKKKQTDLVVADAHAQGLTANIYIYTNTCSDEYNIYI